MEDASALRMVSYGVVAANKPLKSMDIEVTPMEKLTMLNGELTDNLTTQNTKGQDADGAAFETTTKSSPTLTATWLAESSNRITAPDVRRGEKVKIWQFADSDKYYWSSLEYNPNLRKRETVTFAISNTVDEKAVSSSENTYSFTMSTHEKVVHLKTTTSDGEPFGYDFFLNTKDGNFQVTDSNENTIVLDSSSNRIIFKVADGSYIDLNAENLFVNVVKNLVMKIGGDFDTDVGGNYTLKVVNNYRTETAKADFVTPSFTTSEAFDCGTTAEVGSSLQVNSDATVNGKVTAGGLSLSGSITSSSGAVFSGVVKAPNIP